MLVQLVGKRPVFFNFRILGTYKSFRRPLNLLDPGKTGSVESFTATAIATTGKPEAGRDDARAGKTIPAYFHCGFT